ncbi:MFS transporter [Thiosocius teredinicola]|uniref:MFS transporter n=1 Tax=Thiosocius teredinicola TaxID=1973002 RepID=UPI000990F6B3
MTAGERRATLGLAGVYGFRMLGLFLILPVFALFAEGLEGATPFLTGLAVGIYGLTQAALQIPFGLLSDRIGRKPVIFGGLLLFAVGSTIAAQAHDVWWVIFGRAVQGSGAIAAAVMALAADLTREENRTKAMATIGMTIGASFMIAMMAGPVLARMIGVSGIFWVTAVLALLGIAVVALVVPTPARSSVHRDAETVPAMFNRVLRNADLLRLDFGIFALHLILTALFLAVPIVLRDLGLAPVHHAALYLPVMLGSIAAMVPFVIIAERRGLMKQVFLGAVACLTLALLLLGATSGHFWAFVAALVLFFSAFNLLEATLPSIVSKVAPVDAKGTAMGVYSTSQFGGAFVGGAVGGWVHQQFGLTGVFFAAATVGVLWLLVAIGMRKPGRYASRLVHLGKVERGAAGELGDRLRAVPGVVEAVIVADEGVAYLKVDRDHLDDGALDEIVARPA